MQSSEEKQNQARKIVRDKMSFIRHFIIYVFTIAVLAVINNTTWGGYQWWLWAALGWGIGVLSHFLSAFLFTGGSLEERMVRKELDKLDEE